METEQKTNGKTGKVVQIYVCTGTNCTFRGATHLLNILRSDDSILDHCSIHEISCINDRCEHSRRSPVVRIDNETFERAQAEIILEEIHKRINR